MKPPKLGTVLPNAKIEYIDHTEDPPRWVTIVECLDEPQAITAAAKLARQKTNKPLYVHHVWGKEMILER
jgi:hypothetical protein